MNNLEIKKIRKELRLTQEKLANELNVSKSLVQKWESGERTPDDYIISLIRKLHKNTQKTTQKNIVNETTEKYSSNRDQKIAEYREEIESIKEEIDFWENKKEDNPEKIDIYNSYISEYENQIKILLDIIKIALKAQKDDINNK